MILDIALIILLIARPSQQLLLWIVALGIIRHWPWTANAVARQFELEQYCGLTAWLARLALPGWTPDEELMSREMERAEKKAQMPVHVLRPDTMEPHAGSADTVAIRPNDDQSIRDQFLDIMADQKDERGGWLFSANQIHAAIGGHRATVLAQVRDRRAATLPPLYRAEDGATTPATYPVTKRG